MRKVNAVEKADKQGPIIMKTYVLLLLILLTISIQCRESGKDIKNMNLDTLQVKVLPQEFNYLAPDGMEIRLLAEAVGGGMCHCRLPAGKTSKAMNHKTVEEIWYFLSGKGIIWRKNNETGDEGIADEVVSGSSINIPVGTSFQLQNTGSENLEFIICTIPRWPGAQEAVEVEGKWTPTISIQN